jgi:hypothetical protein
MKNLEIGYLPSNKVALLERGKLRGRAVTLMVKEDSFNFGAYAIYGRNTSVLRKLEKKLDIHINWRNELLVPRASKRAAAQELKWTIIYNRQPSSPRDRVMVAYSCVKK